MFPTNYSMVAINEEVNDALHSRQPIVALESSIVAQGLPYPINIETQKTCEEIIRANNCVPATIAVIDGRIRVGITAQELEWIGDNRHNTTLCKISAHNLAAAIAKQLTGGTTVSATMHIAEKVGIKIFATGGIGGVHRGAEFSFDVSLDLVSLATRKVAVVCAGAKSILDIGKTLEKLETLGVPIIGYGTNIFPAFYCRESSFLCSDRADTPKEIAQIINAHWQLELSSGLLIANPIEQAYSLNFHEMEQLITQAIDDADAHGVRGKEVTPYLLMKLASYSHDTTLKANVALVKSNAQLASAIALKLGLV